MAGAAPATAAAKARRRAGSVGRPVGRSSTLPRSRLDKGSEGAPDPRPPPSAPLAGPCRCRAPPRSRRPRRESAAPPVCPAAAPRPTPRVARPGQRSHRRYRGAAAARRGARSAGACRSSARLPVGPILAGGEPVYLFGQLGECGAQLLDLTRSEFVLAVAVDGVPDGVTGPCPPRRENLGGQVADEADRIAGEVAGRTLETGL